MSPRLALFAGCALALLMGAAACSDNDSQSGGSARSRRTAGALSTAFGATDVANTPASTGSAAATPVTANTPARTVSAVAAAATATRPPTSQSGGSGADPVTFFGKASSDSAFQDYVLKNGCESNNLARRCRASGVEFTLDTGGIIAGVIYILVPDNVYAAYSGKLPGGLAVTDKKGDVDRKLGAPTTSGADFAAYPPPVAGTISLFVEFSPVGGPVTSQSSMRRVSFRRR